MIRPNESRIAHWSRATQAGLVLLAQAFVPSFFAGLPESLICPECKPACQCKEEEKPKKKPGRPKKA
jgi:hypothetical protein